MSDTAPPTTEDLFVYATNDGGLYPENMRQARFERDHPNARAYSSAAQWLANAHMAVHKWSREFPNDPVVTSPGTILALAADLRTYYVQAALEE